jgi:hypothetical protein
MCQNLDSRFLLFYCLVIFFSFYSSFVAFWVFQFFIAFPPFLFGFLLPFLFLLCFGLSFSSPMSFISSLRQLAWD